MNKSNKGASTDIIHILCDISASVLAIAISVLICEYVILRSIDIYRDIYFACLFIVIFVFSAKDQRLYNMTAFIYEDRILKSIFKAFCAGAILVSLILIVNDTNIDSRMFFFVFFSIGLIMLLSSNLFFIRKLLPKLKDTNVLFFGSAEDYSKFMYFQNKTSAPINVVQHLDYETNRLSLDNLFKTMAIDCVYTFRDKLEMNDLRRITQICLDRGIVVRELFEPLRSDCNSYVSSVGTYPVLTYHNVSLNRTEQFLKRIMDILLSITGIILSSPIMLVAAVAIKLDSKGPVLFKQKRVGKNGRFFTMYKFRSMRTDAEELKKEMAAMNEFSDGLMFKIKNDPRITRVGNFLRKTSIDEVPQFFNVLLGDMSMVGTRPPTVEEVDQYDRNHWKRLSVKPGITGMWQVNGRNQVLTFDEVVNFDVVYIENWSIFLDTKILFKTFMVLLSRKGAY